MLVNQGFIAIPQSPQLLDNHLQLFNKLICPTLDSSTFTTASLWTLRYPSWMLRYPLFQELENPSYQHIELHSDFVPKIE